jgi:hypothetical protein
MMHTVWWRARDYVIMMMMMRRRWRRRRRRKEVNEDCRNL